MYLNGYFQQSRSSVLLESEGESEIPEALPAEDEVVLADESDVAGAPPALPAVGAELSSVGPPEVVWHVARIILIFYTKTIINFKGRCRFFRPNPPTTFLSPPSSFSTWPSHRYPTSHSSHFCCSFVLQPPKTIAMQQSQ